MLYEVITVNIPDPPQLAEIPLAVHPARAVEPLEGYGFEGFRNPDGSVGTRNILGICTSVQCVAGVANYRITSYNVCYTKLLRIYRIGDHGQADEQKPAQGRLQAGGDGQEQSGGGRSGRRRSHRGRQPESGGRTGRHHYYHVAQLPPRERNNFV